MNRFFIFAIILTSFLLAFFFYPQMPALMASHWNINGEVDGYMGKTWALFLMPTLSLFMTILFLVIPKIDPLKENIKKFKNYFDGFIVLILLFLFYLYLLTIFWNLGIRFNLINLLVPAFGILFYYCGVLIEKAQRNWSIGIRTPWTLSSDRVWQKTHELGGRLFKICGLISLLGFFFQKIAFFLVVVPVLLVTIYTYIYSYLQFQKEKK